jgi:hypothetical protein
MSKQSCGNCDAFLANKDIQVKLGFVRQGWCRANPPALVQMLAAGANGQPVPVYQGVFVPTASDVWCRQWRFKDPDFREVDAPRKQVIDLEATDAANNKPTAE